ncbi:MAG: hypothetical protein LBN05_08390 [Oscillospiraceae bacterium]|jgi:hypothetical protein|nr:hypothetical protein [Oscillospiraceae bacterium]
MKSWMKACWRAFSVVGIGVLLAALTFLVPPDTLAWYGKAILSLAILLVSFAVAGIQLGIQLQKQTEECARITQNRDGLKETIELQYKPRLKRFKSHSYQTDQFMALLVAHETSTCEIGMRVYHMYLLSKQQLQEDQHD